MKLSHIIGLIVIVVAIVVIVSTTAEVSTYATFAEATEIAAKDSDRKIHVSGFLKKDASGQLVDINYQPEIDPNRFTFRLIDRNREEKIVIYSNPKPQDFERSDSIVVIGNMQHGAFVAEKMLLKCPSKYTETEIKGAEKARTQASL